LKKKYSKKLNKLFCLPGVACPIDVCVKNIPPAGITYIYLRTRLIWKKTDDSNKGSVIRAQAFYSKFDHVHEPITRCENHKKNKEFESEASNFIINDEILSHFIRSRHPKAIYEKDMQTSRESVVVPFERPKSIYFV
jgi:hypothetical protein